MFRFVFAKPQPWKKELVTVDIICKCFKQNDFGFSDTVAHLEACEETQMVAADALFAMWQQNSLTESAVMTKYALIEGMTEIKDLWNTTNSAYDKIKVEDLSQFTKVN